MVVIKIPLKCPHRNDTWNALAYEIQCPNLTNNFLLMIPNYNDLFDALNLLQAKQKILL